MKHKTYYKFRYPLIAASLILTWVISATYIVQSNTPTSDQGAIRGPASITNTSKDQMLDKDHPLVREVHTLAVHAYLWGSTLVRLEQVARDYTDISKPQDGTSYRAKLNYFGHARKLPGPNDKASGNQDTLYSSAILDVGQSPMVLSVPAVKDRYFVIDMFDMWHNLFQYVGTRQTGRDAKKFLIVPPNWMQDIDVPKDLTIVRAPTSKVWLWGRTQLLGESDLVNVHKIQDQYTLTPLDVYLGKKDFMFFRPLAQRPGHAGDPLRFYDEIAEYIKVNPLNESDMGIYKQFEKIGLTESGFEKERLSQQFKDVLADAIKDAKAIVDSQVHNPNVFTIENGWAYCFVLDNFKHDYALRSMVADSYLGAQGAHEVLNPLAITDIYGDKLNGQKEYKIHFPSAPPVKGFWSITSYDKKTKLLIKNPLNRYSINDRSKIKKNKDGSFDLYLSHKMPEDESLLTNWLPISKEGFFLITRLYIPSKEILDMKWTVPAIEPLEAKAITSN